MGVGLVCSKTRVHSAYIDTLQISLLKLTSANIGKSRHVLVHVVFTLDFNLLFKTAWTSNVC